MCTGAVALAVGQSTLLPCTAFIALHKHVALLQLADRGMRLGTASFMRFATAGLGAHTCELKEPVPVILLT
jgi:hypothetical protein